MIRLDDARVHAAEALFREVVELPAEARRAVVQAHCGADRELCSLVEQLLVLDAGSSSLAQNTLRLLPFVEAHFPAAPQAHFGRYEIVRELGRGGVGVVYEARQENPHRLVALKLLRFASPGTEVLRRFQLEAEALGQLNHPGIAQIYEAGVEEVTNAAGLRQSTPFVAMELVRGQSLTEYADGARLDIRARLDLLAQICEAVQHAHQKSVIHRDLKPGNILVTDAAAAESGDSPNPAPHSRPFPKIVDFGVARVGGGLAAEANEPTQAGQLLGTIAYMSPEQLAGDPRAIDTRSDVYALGVIGYELLAGKRPIDISGQSLPNAIRMLAEAEPPPAGSVRRGLRGDIELILAKAMRKSPAGRYGSAAELAADLRRVIRNEPISARPPALGYQISRFVRRNRALVAASAIVAVTIIGAAGWTTWALVRARIANSRASAMNEFLKDVIVAADPAKGRADVKLVELLRSAADEAASRFADYPETEADVRHLLGRAYYNMSLYEDSLIHLKRAHELHIAALGEEHPASLELAGNYADTLLRLDRTSEARRVAERVLALTPADRQFQNTAIATRRTLAVVMAKADQSDAAEQEFRELVRLSREYLGQRHQTTLASANDLAWFLSSRAYRGASRDREQDAAEAAALFEEILPLHIDVHGEASRATLNLMSNLAPALLLAGKVDRAAEMAERVLALAPPRFGQDHGICHRARGALQRARLAQGRYAEAAALAIATVDSINRLTGNSASIESLSEMSDVLHILDAGDRVLEGEQYARTLLEQMGNAGGHGGADAQRYRVDLAHFLSRQGRLDEADTVFNAILPTVTDDLHPENRARIDLAYGGHLARRGQFEEAEKRLLAAEPFPWLIAGLSVVAQQEFVRLYDAWGKPDQAAIHRAQFGPNSAVAPPTAP